MASTVIDFGKTFAFGGKGFKVGRETWADDESVTHCGGCSAEFGVLLRRHHCRACGNIFCWRCSSKRISFTACTRASEPGYKEKQKRVCRDCFSGITEMRSRISAKTLLAPSRAHAGRGPGAASMALPEEATCCYGVPGKPGFMLYTPQQSRDNMLAEVLAEQEAVVLDMLFDTALQRQDAPSKALPEEATFFYSVPCTSGLMLYTPQQSRDNMLAEVLVDKEAVALDMLFDTALQRQGAASMALPEEPICCYSVPGTPSLTLYTPQQSRDTLAEVLAEKEAAFRDMLLNSALQKLELAPREPGSERPRRE